jgi:hypothetical protein
MAAVIEEAAEAVEAVEAAEVAEVAEAVAEQAVAAKTKPKDGCPSLNSVV